MRIFIKAILKDGAVFTQEVGSILEGLNLTSVNGRLISSYPDRVFSQDEVAEDILEIEDCLALFGEFLLYSSDATETYDFIDELKELYLLAEEER